MNAQSTATSFFEHTWVWYLARLLRIIIAIIFVFFGFRVVHCISRLLLWRLRRRLEARLGHTGEQDVVTNCTGVLPDVTGRKLKNIDPLLIDFCRSVTTLALKVLVILIALALASISSESVAVFMTTLLLAVGLADQGILQDAASGLLILISHPFRVNDLVRFAGCDWAGFVEGVSLMSTKLRKVNHEVILMPNSLITKHAIYGLDHNPIICVETPFKMEYSNDHLMVKRVLLEKVRKVAKVLPKPEPQVLFTSLDERGVGFIVRVWVNSQDLLQTRFVIRKLTIKTFIEYNFKFFTVGRHAYRYTQERRSTFDDEDSDQFSTGPVDNYGEI